MPIPIKILQPDGTIGDAPITAGSLNDLALREPEGIYTVARTFERVKAVLFGAHLDRLEESAHIEGIHARMDRTALRAALVQLLEESENAESRFRITIPRAQPELTWLAAEPLMLLPPELKLRGVSAATYAVTRPNPKSKSNAWVSLRNQAIKDLPPLAYEGIILHQGRLMEGFSSNVYVVKRGVLFTADHGILHGIARQIVLQVVPGIIPLQFEAIEMRALSQAQEAFLTSSSRGVVPIVQVDATIIGGGKPGPITHRISQAYDTWVSEHLEPIYDPS